MLCGKMSGLFGQGGSNDQSSSVSKTYQCGLHLLFFALVGSGGALSAVVQDRYGDTVGLLRLVYLEELVCRGSRTRRLLEIYFQVFCRQTREGTRTGSVSTSPLT